MRYLAIILLLAACGATIEPTKFTWNAEKGMEWTEHDKSMKETQKALDAQADAALCAMPQPKPPAIIYSLKNGKCVGDYQP
jgi:hypothetical protein